MADSENAAVSFGYANGAARLTRSLSASAAIKTHSGDCRYYVIAGCFSRGNQRLRHHASNPLHLELVVDEASMISIAYPADETIALPIMRGGVLIQLASVEAEVLGDICVLVLMPACRQACHA